MNPFFRSLFVFFRRLIPPLNRFVKIKQKEKSWTNISRVIKMTQLNSNIVFYTFELNYFAKMIRILGLLRAWNKTRAVKFEEKTFKLARACSILKKLTSIFLNFNQFNLSCIYRIKYEYSSLLIAASISTQLTSVPLLYWKGTSILFWIK